MTLPDIDTKIIPVQFTIAERQFYDALHRKSLNLFEGYIQSGTASKSWLAIFSLLQRLRQTCDHVALTIKSHINHDEWSSNISSSQQEQNVSCCQNVDKDDNETQQLDRKGSKNAIDPKVRFFFFFVSICMNTLEPKTNKLTICLFFCVFLPQKQTFKTKH